MSFEFQLLSLLMVFLLVIIYYMKRESFTKGNKVFRGILLVTYVMQLCNFGIYITREIGSKSFVFSKFYLIMVMLWFALFGFYYVSVFLKERYLQSEGKLRSIMQTLLIYFGVIQLIGGIAILFVPVLQVDGMINFSRNIVVYLAGFYLIIELLVLILGSKQVEKAKYYHLIIIFLIQVISLFLQCRSLELPLLNIGIVFCTFYSYFLLENIEKEEVKKLKLERDYAMRQAIDKSEFLKVLSHEIRTPLNAIDGFSQVVLESDNMDEIKGDIRDIRMASRDLIDVINGMIDLSMIESGKLEIIEENYNVYDMFDNIVGIAEAKMREKKVEFHASIDNNIPEVLLGDSERISQVVLNLLTNSIKFTDAGSITLRVQSVRAASKCRLKIIVEDTGRGIKKEDLTTIFEMGTLQEGTNLGLKVSKYLVDLMGGMIEVESTFGNGSTFSVAIDQKVISERQEIKASRVKVLKPFKATGKRILLVDDNKLNLKVASKLLQPYDVDIVESKSGKDCLDILEHDHDFDLILMDDLMPEMSGTECLDILKKIERVDGYYIPVVVLTANAVSGVREKYLEVGFEDYLAKPIDKYELDRIMKKYLKGKK